MLPEYYEIVEWLPQLLLGLKTSLQVTALALVIGIPLGLLMALGNMSANKLVQAVSLFFIEVGRGAPALVLLQFIYFGLPTTGLTVGALFCAVFALAWNTGAYTSEIIRASLLSIPAGQREAAEAMGFNKLDELRFVMVPQAMRVATPALLAFAILVFQGTSLAFTVALPELVSRAYQIGSETFRYLPVLLLAGALYAVISIPAALMVDYIEKRAGRFAER